jgi:hypothetical protein
MGKRKNSKNKKNNACWNYCTMIDGQRMHLQCNSCSHTMGGGVTRLKHHFARTRKDVEACKSCPENLIETYKKYLKKAL